jgi:hypothetical protein
MEVEPSKNWLRHRTQYIYNLNNKKQKRKVKFCRTNKLLSFSILLYVNLYKRFKAISMFVKNDIFYQINFFTFTLLNLYRYVIKWSQVNVFVFRK